MARVEISDGFYFLRLTRWERFFALHGDLKVAESALESRVKVENPWNRETLKGVRSPGTAIPFLVLLGTMRYRGGKDFTAIYKRKPVDVYTFTSGEFNRWIVSST
jgi:hypothetical protein